MDKTVLEFLAEGLFYDTPAPGARWRAPAHPYRLPQGLDWSGWRQRCTPDWLGVHTGPELPQQGWKIHVSATLDNAPSLLDQVSGYAWQNRLSFKFAPTRAALIARNGKQANRGMSGKFITLYPRDEEQLYTTLVELDRLVGGAEGPYILSDLRWNRGPLHVRYGAFQPRTAVLDGERVPVILDPEGRPVPDVRSPSFAVPPWVRIPAFLADQLQRLGGDQPPDRFPYRIREALHFSNGGGIYRAEETGPGPQPVVLKEARPHAGLTPDGRDAIARLDHESAVLDLLKADPAVVTRRALVTLGGHRFLVLDQIDGIPLTQAVTQRCPAVRANAAPGDYLEYRDWAIGVIDSLSAALDRIHRAGIVHNDLHPGNVMLTPDDKIVLLDFEMSTSIDDTETTLAAAPAFTPPPDRIGAAADDWALAAVALFLFLPLTPLLRLDPNKADQLIDTAARTYLLPEPLVRRLRTELAGSAPAPRRSRQAEHADALLHTWPVGDHDGIRAIQAGIGRSLDASADYARADRCYPGDPQQFRENGYTLAHGAAGVVHAQLVASLGVRPAALDWLHDALDADPTPRLGLYDGLAGVAWVLRRLGEEDTADRLLDRLVSALWPGGSGQPRTRLLTADLYGGLSGIGLFLLDETGAAGRRGREPRWLLGLADRLGDELAARLEAGTAFTPTSRHTAHGLMWGPTGLALFATRLFEHTGEARHLRLAQAALDADLAQCITAVDGSLQMNEGWRLMPYLATGSGGIALVAAQLQRHLADPEPQLKAIDAIQLALQPSFTIESTLFNGRAGFIHILAALDRLGLASPASRTALDAHVSALRLHALRHATGIVFAGSGLLRASTDLATGSAGVLTALQAYADLRFRPSRSGWDRQLPLLLPTPLGVPTSPKGGESQ